jgi:hypothetical protein
LGVAQSSGAARPAASETSYYREGDTMWLKLFAEKGGGGFNAPPSLTVSKGKALAALDR